MGCLRSLLMQSSPKVGSFLEKQQNAALPILSPRLDKKDLPIGKSFLFERIKTTESTQEKQQVIESLNAV